MHIIKVEEYFHKLHIILYRSKIKIFLSFQLLIHSIKLRVLPLLSDLLGLRWRMCKVMWKKQQILVFIRHYSRISPPRPAVVRVSRKCIAELGPPKGGPKPRQLLSLPPFPGPDLPGKNWGSDPDRVTAISWIKYYFDEVQDSVIQSHFNKGLVSIFIVSVFMFYSCFRIPWYFWLWLLLILWFFLFVKLVCNLVFWIF